MTDRVSPEDFVFSLLRENPPLDEINKYAGELKENDWQEIVNFTTSHSLFPAFYDRLVRMKISHVPEEILSHLKGMYLLNLKKNIFLEDELFKVLDYLKSCNIPAIPLKGTALAGLIYKDIALRQAPCDMDILVPEDRLIEAEKSLEKIGYSFLYEAHFNEVEQKFQKMGFSFKHNQHIIDILHKYRSEVSFKKELYGFNLNIDLHWTFRDKFVNIDIKNFWTDVKEIELNGHKILMPPVEVIFYHLLIVSIARYDFVSIKNIYDIYKLITIHRENINWENMLKRVKKNKLNHLLYFTLVITEELFKVNVP
ncbi:MAG: nucleotidyltransferase family protein, partial [Candidatus Eremiobacterota bacterium]